jgi:N-acyl-D-amino-acid deacylase
MHDLVIRNATIIDGTGAERFEGAVAIDNGRITSVDATATRGREELDAADRIVTPGFVDPHTHYDGQATWDEQLAPSVWHGVTTVVMGNCGVGFAPAARDRHEWLIGLMEGVEDIPGAALADGLRWNWETFPEYLDALSEVPRSIDVVAQVAHGAVRAYVMGERGAANEEPTPDDIARMARIVGDGIAAGALGFSTSRLPGHRAIDGRVVPGTYAEEAELVAIAHAMSQRSGGRAVFEMVTGTAAASATVEHWHAELDWMARLSRSTGTPVLFGFGAPDTWTQLIGTIDAANASGARLVPQISCRPVGSLLGLQAKHPFQGRASYDEIAHLPLDARVMAMRDPERRARILAERTTRRDVSLPYDVTTLLEAVYPMGPELDYEPPASHSIAAQAAAQRIDPVGLLYDELLADDGRALVMFALGNYRFANLDHSYELMRRQDTVVGLGDGGAHVSFICDAGYPTFLLSHWARDRSRGPRLPLELVVRKLTSEPARAYGLGDRGVLAPGRRADVNIIDPDRVTLTAPYIAHDLPTGAPRLLQRAIGYEATLLAGVCIQRDGDDTGARPGRLVRGHQGP